MSVVLKFPRDISLLWALDGSIILALQVPKHWEIFSYDFVVTFLQLTVLFFGTPVVWMLELPKFFSKF